MPDNAVLKVSVPSADVLRRIGGDPPPLALRGGPAMRVFYRDLYFDTPDRLLDQRGVICRLRIPSQGTRTLTVKVREITQAGPVHSNVVTSELSGDPGQRPFDESTNAVSVLRAVIDPARLNPWLELETDRLVRTARHWWAIHPRLEFRYDSVTARADGRVGSFYEMTVRQLRSGGPGLDRVARALAERYALQPVLGDKLARARALFSSQDIDALEQAVLTTREVAVLPFDLGRLGLRVENGVLTVLGGPGAGEDACRSVLRTHFKSGQAQLRPLGVAPAVGERPALEVWIARRIPSARNGDVPLEWLFLDNAISLVGSPSVRDARTLAALHVAARSDIMQERPVWAVHTPVPESTSLYLSDELPLPDFRSTTIVDPVLPRKALNATRPDPEQFISRDLSQLAFNTRVLELAEDRRLPILERARFLSIFASNTDEMFMVRVGALKYVLAQGSSGKSIDGLTGSERLDAIAIRARYLMERAYRCLWASLLPELAPEEVSILDWEDLDDAERAHLVRHFQEQIYPVLTPLAATPGHPFPHIPSLTIAIAVTVRQPSTGVTHFAAVTVPKSLPRFTALPDTHRFVPLESVIRANIALLFPGLEVHRAYWFRATRSAEIPLDEWNSLDLLQTMEEKIERRPFGPVVRLEVERSMPQSMRELLLQEFRFEETGQVSMLSETDVYDVERLPDLTGLDQIADLANPELRYPPFHGSDPLDSGRPVLAHVRERDVVLHFPYDSFDATLERFFVEAADDPDVLAIKVTLYRTNTESRIVDALVRAAQRGKEVLAIVELKARFEEERNIEWAKALEALGIHVVYGLLGLKTHAKIGLVVRREGTMRRYSFIGSGNLNSETARVYTDVALLTSDADIGADLNDVFNSLSGNSTQGEYRRALVAPSMMRDRFLQLIEREIEHARAGRGGRIRATMNGLADPDVIGALYRASQAGVEINLIVRGICCLRPGVRGLSDRIRVVSILGQFLEHARMFHFGNGGDDEYYLGSADWRPRNLRRRVEVVVPVTDPKGRARLDEILSLQIADVGSWELGADGSYFRRIVEEPTSQELLMHSGRE